MDERFLHYIWKFQKFEQTDLKTTEGQSLVVLTQGNHNHHSGPDFEEARLKIGDMEWAGNVEIHVDSADWQRHNHQNDRCYDNVILHVVWTNTRQVYLGTEPIPTLELNSITCQNLYRDYDSFLSQKKEILCENYLPQVSPITFTGTLDRMLVERLEQKSEFISDLLQINNHDWESATYEALAANFGFSLNKEPFRILVSSLPYKVLSKYHGKQTSSDALVFGQAGFLEEITDPYQEELKVEYEYLKAKHQLTRKLDRTAWKSGRMRPANFPSVRLAQFSAITTSNSHLFSTLLQVENPRDLINRFQVHPSEYWSTHYDFGKPWKKKKSGIGTSTLVNLFINTIAPVLAAYSKYMDDQKYMDKAMRILERLPAEQNAITKKWNQYIKAENAFDSQALIGLYKNYCLNKRCLDCSIGVEILGK